MSKPVFNLPVLVPGQTTKQLLEGEVNRVIGALYSVANPEDRERAEDAGNRAEEAADRTDLSAADAASSAANAASSAAIAESSAIAAGAPIYPDNDAGLAATISGQFFYVPELGGLAVVENLAGEAARRGFLGQPIFAIRSTLEAAVAAGYSPQHGTVINAGGVQYLRVEGDDDVLGGLPGWLPFAIVSVDAFEEAGAADSSAAWSAAVNYLAALGGGVLVGKAGHEYIAQGIPLRENVYFDLRGVKIRLPAGPTQPMFKAPEGYNSFDGTGMIAGGIIGGTLDGIDKSQNGIDFQDIGRLERFWLQDVYMSNFDHCYIGSGNDRRPIILGCQFLDSNVGVRVLTNHPHIRYCDFRRCDVGLQGAINDLDCIGSVFRSCRAGVEPLGSNNIRNSLFVGCAFHGCTDKGAEVTGTTTFSSCRFHGGPGSDYGLVVRGTGNRIVGNYFGYDDNIDGFNVAPLDIRVTGSQTDNLVVTGNHFQGSPNSVSQIIFSGTGGQLMRSGNITGNSFRLSSGRKAFLALSGVVAHPVFANNTFTLLGSGYTSEDGIIEIASLGSSGGNFTGNSFFGTVSQPDCRAIKLSNANLSIITDNKFRNFSNAIEISSGMGGIRFDNNVGAQEEFLGQLPARNRTGRITLSDNTAVAVTIYGTGIRGALIDMFAHQKTFDGVRVWVRVGGAPDEARVVSNNSLGTITSLNGMILDGTTGSEGSFNVSSSGSLVYFENRTGANVDFTYIMNVSN
jgi:hypothetical protein